MSSVLQGEMLQRKSLEMEHWKIVKENLHLRTELAALKTQVNELATHKKKKTTLRFKKDKDEKETEEGTTVNIDYGPCIKEGWLLKRGPGGPGKGKWKKRWFRLFKEFVFYLKAPKDAKPKGIIPIIGDDTISDSDKKDNCFAMHTPTRTYYISAADEAECNSWMVAIKACIQSLEKGGVMALLTRLSDQNRDQDISTISDVAATTAPDILGTDDQPYGQMPIYNDNSSVVDAIDSNQESIQKSNEFKHDYGGLPK